MNAAGQETELRIKQREAFYCNVKLLLMFMVVYGHMIESMIDNVELLMQIYRVIYSVHMPLFLFLSGLFLKSRTGCLRQAKQILLYYGICQTAVVILGRIAGEQLRLDTPVWTLWYLLSLASMACVGWCWYAATERWQRLNNGVVKAALLILAVYTIFLLYKLFQWRCSLYSLTTVKKEEHGQKRNPIYVRPDMK